MPMAWAITMGTAPTEKGESMEKFRYYPTYDNRLGGYTSPSDAIELDFQNLKNRLIDDVLNDEDKHGILTAFDIQIDNVTVHGENTGLWYFDTFVDVGQHRYRLGKSREDILDFIHYFDIYVNPDFILKQDM